MKYLIISIAVILTSCQSANDYDHTHNDEDGHSIDNIEIPATDATIWTDKTELFVEFPQLIVGKSSRFAAHFTLLENHQPVRQGSVSVSLVKGNNELTNKVDLPSSPGIFIPSLQPVEAGIYKLIFDLKTPDYSDQIVLEGVQVYANLEDLKRSLGSAKEKAGAITFLKEQAWKMKFQTAPVVNKEIYQIIPTSGVWKAAPSDYRTLVATTSGTIAIKRGILTEGSRVKKGQVLMSISSAGLTSNNLEAEIQKAKSRYDQAEAEYERKKELYESKIVPKAEFEQVEHKFQVSKANYETLKAGYTSEGKQVVVPFDGYLNSINVENGMFVEQGSALVTVTSQKSSLLEAKVSSSYAVDLQNIHNLWYKAKSNKWSSLNEKSGKILSVEKVVEANNPLLSVFAQINEVVEMPEGSFTEVQIAVGLPIKSLVIPKSALLEDYGNYSVIAQLSGESFERRNVSIGKQNGSEVEIKEGLKLGEVVVTKGAYQVKMASMSGQVPAHGHAH